jgi:hypothetical protein
MKTAIIIAASLWILLVACMCAVRAETATPQQLQDYVGLLLQDRQAYAQQIDQLRLQIAERDRQAADLADYWARYVAGLQEKK